MQLSILALCAIPSSRLGLSFVNRTPNPFSKPCECNAQEPPKVGGRVHGESHNSGSQDEHYDIIYVTSGLCTTKEISQIVAGIVGAAHMLETAIFTYAPYRLNYKEPKNSKYLSDNPVDHYEPVQHII